MIRRLAAEGKNQGTQSVCVLEILLSLRSDLSRRTTHDASPQIGVDYFFYFYISSMLKPYKSKVRSAEALSRAPTE